MTGPECNYWLEQTEADVPPGDQWLGARERSHLASLRFPKRRMDWRLGRWTAKRALTRCLNLPADNQSLRDVEILASPSGAPQVFLFTQAANVSISLSHRAGQGFCVVGLSGASLGCDLELIESREHSFVSDFFTASEQQLVDSAPAEQAPMLTTLLWSAKESALKALQVGLRLDTTSLDVSLDPEMHGPRDCVGLGDVEVWSSLSVRCGSGQVLRAWWRCANGVVRTVVLNTRQTGLEY